MTLGEDHPNNNVAGGEYGDGSQRAQSFSFGMLRAQSDHSFSQSLPMRLRTSLATSFRPRTIRAASSRVASGTNVMVPSAMRRVNFGAPSQRGSGNWL